jgi:hypothetical protein
MTTGQDELFPDIEMTTYCRCCDGVGHHGNPWPESGDLYRPCDVCRATGKIPLTQPVFRTRRCEYHSKEGATDDDK